MKAPDEMFEPRVYVCAKRCGEEFVTYVSDESKLSNSEQEYAQLDEAGWVILDSGTFCSDCAPNAPLSHLENMDRIADSLED